MGVSEKVISQQSDSTYCNGCMRLKKQEWSKDPCRNEMKEDATLSQFDE